MRRIQGDMLVARKPPGPSLTALVPVLDLLAKRLADMFWHCFPTMRNPP